VAALLSGGATPGLNAPGRFIAAQRTPCLLDKCVRTLYTVANNRRPAPTVAALCGL